VQGDKDKATQSQVRATKGVRFRLLLSTRRES